MAHSAARQAEDLLWSALSGRLRRRLAGPGLVDPTPHAVFGHTGDRFWLWANTEGYRRIPAFRTALPDLPPEGVQRQFTGKSGDATLREGWEFYRLVKRLAARYGPGPLAGSAGVMEFGCGWGRVIRFFVKDLDADRLVGLDCLPEVVACSRATNRWARFELVPALPPTGLDDGRFDLIYAYSVFSHLSEESHLRWIDELRRMLRPGGLLVTTTRPRDFIVSCGNLREALAQGAAVKKSGASRAFVGTDVWTERYDRGEFCHDAVGGGPALSSDFYGETAIPRAYVERAWRARGLPLVDYLSGLRGCGQDVIVARRG